MKKHKIMITNDDGIQSVGLRAAPYCASFMVRYHRFPYPLDADGVF